MYKYREIKIFIAVMRTGSATHAANSLNMTQPNVTKAIRGLEAKLGVVLFVRLGGRLAPTPEAEKLYEQAIQVRQEMAQFERYAHKLKVDGTGILRVISLPVFALWLLPKAIELLLQEFPKTEFRIDLGHENDVSRGISSGQYDLGILHFVDAYKNQQVATQSIVEKNLVYAIPKNHPLALKTKINPSNLADETVVSYPEFLEFRQAIDAYMQEMDVNFNPSIIVNYTSLALEIVAGGNAVAIVDQFATKKYHEKIKFFEIADGPKISFGLISQMAKPKSILADRFGSILQKLITEG